MARLRRESGPWNEEWQALGEHWVATKADAGAMTIKALENWLQSTFGLGKSVPNRP